MQAPEDYNGVQRGSDEFPQQERSPAGSSEADHHSGGSTNNATNRELRGKRPKLPIQIPWPSDFGRYGNGKTIQTPRSICSSASGSFRPRQSIKSPSLADERTPLLNPDQRLNFEGSSLASYIRALSWKRSTSLPATPASNLSPSIVPSQGIKTCRGQLSAHRHQIEEGISRSLSVPARNVVILRSGSISTPTELEPTGKVEPALVDPGEEEIPVEEAICRVCCDGLQEGGLKLECSCKGALRLIHEACAVRWFNIKGNKICDVCGQKVLNLPVTLLRLESNVQRDNRQINARDNSNSELIRAWQDVVVLVLISMMCYFFFVEQLLVDDMKASAINIALPSSLLLATVASILAIVLARREYVWAYAAFQFAVVTIFLHLLCTMRRVGAVYAVFFAAAVGFTITAAINSLCLFICSWRPQVLEAQLNSNAV